VRLRPSTESSLETAVPDTGFVEVCRTNAGGVTLFEHIVVIAPVLHHHTAEVSVVYQKGH
jgi:hypothetical protein